MSADDVSFAAAGRRRKRYAWNDDVAEAAKKKGPKSSIAFPRGPGSARRLEVASGQSSSSPETETGASSSSNIHTRQQVPEGLDLDRTTHYRTGETKSTHDDLNEDEGRITMRNHHQPRITPRSHHHHHSNQSTSASSAAASAASKNTSSSLPRAHHQSSTTNIHSSGGNANNHDKNYTFQKYQQERQRLVRQHPWRNDAASRSAGKSRKKRKSYWKSLLKRGNAVPWDEPEGMHMCTSIREIPVLEEEEEEAEEENNLSDGGSSDATPSLRDLPRSRLDDALARVKTTSPPQETRSTIKASLSRDEDENIQKNPSDEHDNDEGDHPLVSTSVGATVRTELNATGDMGISKIHRGGKSNDSSNMAGDSDAVVAAKRLIRYRDEKLPLLDPLSSSHHPAAKKLIQCRSDKKLDDRSSLSSHAAAAATKRFARYRDEKPLPDPIAPSSRATTPPVTTKAGPLIIASKNRRQTSEVSFVTRRRHQHVGRVYSPEKDMDHWKNRDVSSNQKASITHSTDINSNDRDHDGLLTSAEKRIIRKAKPSIKPSIRRPDAEPSVSDDIAPISQQQKLQTAATIEPTDSLGELSPPVSPIISASPISATVDVDVGERRTHTGNLEESPMEDTDNKTAVQDAAVKDITKNSVTSSSATSTSQDLRQELEERLLRVYTGDHKVIQAMGRGIGKRQPPPPEQNYQSSVRQQLIGALKERLSHRYTGHFKSVESSGQTERIINTEPAALSNLKNNDSRDTSVTTPATIDTVNFDDEEDYDDDSSLESVATVQGMICAVAQSRPSERQFLGDDGDDYYYDDDDDDAASVWTEVTMESCFHTSQHNLPVPSTLKQSSVAQSEEEMDVDAMALEVAEMRARQLARLQSFLPGVKAPQQEHDAVVDTAQSSHSVPVNDNNTNNGWLHRASGQAESTAESMKHDENANDDDDASYDEITVASEALTSRSQQIARLQASLPNFSRVIPATHSGSDDASYDEVTVATEAPSQPQQFGKFNHIIPPYKRADSESEDDDASYDEITVASETPVSRSQHIAKLMGSFAQRTLTEEEVIVANAAANVARTRSAEESDDASYDEMTVASEGPGSRSQQIAKLESSLPLHYSGAGASTKGSKSFHEESIVASEAPTPRSHNITCNDEEDDASYDEVTVATEVPSSQLQQITGLTSSFSDQVSLEETSSRTTGHDGNVEDDSSCDEVTVATEAPNSRLQQIASLKNSLPQRLPFEAAQVVNEERETDDASYDEVTVATEAPTDRLQQIAILKNSLSAGLNTGSENFPILVDGDDEASFDEVTVATEAPTSQRGHSFDKVTVGTENMAIVNRLPIESILTHEDDDEASYDEITVMSEAMPSRSQQIDRLRESLPAHCRTDTHSRERSAHADQLLTGQLLENERTIEDIADALLSMPHALQNLPKPSPHEMLGQGYTDDGGVAAYRLDDEDSSDYDDEDDDGWDDFTVDTVADAFVSLPVNVQLEFLLNSSTHVDEANLVDQHKNEQKGNDDNDDDAEKNYEEQNMVALSNTQPQQKLALASNDSPLNHMRKRPELPRVQHKQRTIDSLVKIKSLYAGTYDEQEASSTKASTDSSECDESSDSWHDARSKSTRESEDSFQDSVADFAALRIRETM